MDPVLIFGSQLFDPTKYIPKQPVILIEHQDLCTYYSFHKHKLVFVLSAMRHFAEELRKLDYKVYYLSIRESQKFESYETALMSVLQSIKATQLTCFEIEDKFMEKRMSNFADKNGIKISYLKNPNFLTTREQFAHYLSQNKKPFMKTFYEFQRKRLKILVDHNLNPEGGSWSFDFENRKALPKDHVAPEVVRSNLDDIDKKTIQDVNHFFSNHIGDTCQFWLPTSRTSAQAWFKKFVHDRLHFFGPYEDAFGSEQDFLYHSGISPFLNVGLLCPKDLIKLTVQSYRNSNLPLNSVEGFIRQIVGWREFVRGIYQHFSEQQETSNFFQHNRKLNKNWYID